MENISRETAYYMAHILAKTDRQQDTIDLIKKVIDMDPHLKSDEQSFLSIVYKNIVIKKREGRTNLIKIMKEHQDPVLHQQLQTFSHEFIDELDFYCKELISIVDEKLLPNAKTPEDQVFYLKLKADYYRYMCEVHTGEAKEELAKPAEKAYKEALSIANAKISQTRPEYLGVILNYTVFLYEILEKKEEALDLAQKTYQEICTKINDDASAETRQTIKSMHDNIENWKASLSME